MSIHTIVASIAPEILEIRHHLHSHPELGMQEHETSAFVAQKLREWGYEVHCGLGRFGVVGTLRVGDGKKTLGIRADMDALPIREINDKPWCSQNEGVMHACGHDGHTAILLGAAKYLAHTKNFNGTVRLIFQPAEEGDGGAEAMVKDGLFEKFPCDVIYGLHNMPGFPVGTCCFRTGPIMASSDGYRVTIQGRGGHGSLPQLAIDPVVVAASMIQAFQTIVSRNVGPLESAVLSVGSIHAGKVFNVIPDQAVMELTVRALSPQVRQHVAERLREIARLQAECFGAKANVEHIVRTPVTVNAEAPTAFVRNLAMQLFGAQHVRDDITPLMGAEDFSYMLEANPNGCYFFLGAGEDSVPIHHPNFDFNDQLIVPGITLWGALTEALLK